MPRRASAGRQAGGGRSIRRPWPRSFRLSSCPRGWRGRFVARRPARSRAASRHARRRRARRQPAPAPALRRARPSRGAGGPTCAARGAWLAVCDWGFAAVLVVGGLADHGACTPSSAPSSLASPSATSSSSSWSSPRRRELPSARISRTALAADVTDTLSQRMSQDLTGTDLLRPSSESTVLSEQSRRRPPAGLEATSGRSSVLSVSSVAELCSAARTTEN